MWLTSRQGISPLIATVLLIGLTVTVALTVILWGRSYIQERAAKEGALSEKQLTCKMISFTATQSYQQSGEVHLVLKNKEDISIDKFTFRIEGSAAEPKERYDTLPSLATKEYILSFTEDELQNIDQVFIVPWLRVASGVYVPCSDQHLTVNILSTS